MIDFEKDQENVLKKTDNIQSLADQVQKLNDISLDIEKLEESLKKRKKEQEHLSGEVIPTMMSEMGLSHLKFFLQLPLLVIQLYYEMLQQPLKVQSFLN